ncbi:MAG: OmpA/MotB [Proteobacteria bacterium]|nr:OmpA/MotB [Pseudomonadota bacterium]
MQDNEKTEMSVVSILLGTLIAFCVFGVIAYGAYLSSTKSPASLTSTEIPAPVGEALAKIYFDVGSAELPAEAGGAIQTVSDKALASPKRIVLISGFHDPSGDPAQNAELARQRAEAAKEALIAAGVPEAQIRLRKPEVIPGDEDMQEARRVDIRVQ